jgi:NAD(P)-dependent dehydrogenase (short-subunit alcohol dehydrogenase family)
MDGAALVTGGSSGIGLAIARALRDEGFELTLAARTREKVEAAAAELDALAVTADLAREEDCRRVVGEHRERHGRLDVLVNSAGVGIGGPIDELPTKHLDVQLDVNLRGLMLVTAAALPLLRETRGLIVNLASIAGTMGTPMLPVYGASKAAVIQFTEHDQPRRAGARRARDGDQPRLRGHADDRFRTGAQGGDDPTRGLRRDRPPSPPTQPSRPRPSRRGRARRSVR